VSAAGTWRAQAAKARAAGRPAVFTIPADSAFVDVLARGILEDAAAAEGGDSEDGARLPRAGDPLALAAVTVLLPTRRACRSLREAFLRLTEGKPLLLPRLLPLNDMDEEETLFSSFSVGDAALDIPPPISGLKRHLMLARLILSLQPEQGERPEQAIRLAQELAKFLDEVQTERASFEKLKDLAPERFAQHWQETLKFMEILTGAWPAILAEEGALDPAEHRNRVFAAQIAAWNAGAAHGPIIAAGSTGSIPATADVLNAIARMDGGCVVLPGLDVHLDDDDWAAVDETHPQYGLKQFLTHMALPRAAVSVWPTAEAGAHSRAAFLSEVMRPAATTHAWQTLPAFEASAVGGLTRLDCAAPREEAEAAALIMREALEHAGRTCALVTPDRALAERVAAELKRWGIDVDDSAGRPLPQTPPGAFLRLTAAMVAQDFAPVPTLAVCKHPLAAAGRDAAGFRALTRLAELEILRGPLPPAGLEGLDHLAAHADPGVNAWIALLRTTCGAFAALMKAPAAPLSGLLAAHMDAAEALAATADTPGPLRLWAEDAGEAAAAFIAQLAQCADTLPPIAPALYPAILEALMESQVVRPRFGKHPRLHILGPLEARLQRFDVLILGGLNEGTWPAAAPADPWMSRPMRQAFGLPLPERRIGQAAHDIAQALSAPRVVLTRAQKVDGTPTVPSRWLMRLERVVDAAGFTAAFARNTGDWRAWTRALTQPAAFTQGAPPAPRPPVSARPRRLSVTAIERWMRDPYSIYAQYILKLKPLDPLEQDAGAADYGTLIHGALKIFIDRHPAGALSPDALARLIDIGRAAFDGHAARPGVMAFWWPRFERIAAWFVEHEGARRAGLAQSHAEVRGELTLSAPGGPFTLVAVADRLDRTRDGRWIIIDYKTGTPPSENEVTNGFAPQLPLEAAMLAKGAFADLLPGPIDSLSFWHLHGRGEGGEERFVKTLAAALASEARLGLLELIAKFDDPATAYEARPNPEYAPKYSDYEHLARVKEWGAGEDEAGS
jgi:ATP-dependent helicase/nuclease subunit B